MVIKGGCYPLQYEDTKSQGAFHLHCETALLLALLYVFSSLLAAIPKVPLSGRNRIAKYPCMHRDLPVGTFGIRLEMTAPETQDKVLIGIDFRVGLTKLLRGGTY